MRSLLNLVENLIGISQIVGMAWITKTLLDACMDVCWCVSRRRQQHIRNAVSILDSARAPVEREGNGRKVKNKKLQNWIHSRILITSNCRTIVSAWHYRNQRKSCSWWIRALEKNQQRIHADWPSIRTPHTHTHTYWYRSSVVRRESHSISLFLCLNGRRETCQLYENDACAGFVSAAAYKSGMLFITRQTSRVTHRTKLLLIHYYYYFSFRISLFTTSVELCENHFSLYRWMSVSSKQVCLRLRRVFISLYYFIVCILYGFSSARFNQHKIRWFGTFIAQHRRTLPKLFVVML